MNETITYIQKSLEALYPPEEIRSLTQWILEKVCNLSRHQQILHKNTQLSCTEKESIQMIVQRLKNSEPVQYIFGETEFYGLPFMVTPAVLIPRPETEELVHRIFQEQKVSGLRVIDIGAGSGCIAVTLARKLTDAQVYALDISEDALQIVQQNAQQNGATVQCMQADILSVDLQKDPALPLFDLIVSNPPYVRESEKATMRPNVLDYEPHLALFVRDEDPILFFRRIAEFGLDKLTENGFIYVEINEVYGEMIEQMFHQKGYQRVERMCDLFGKERFIKARR